MRHSIIVIAIILLPTLAAAEPLPGTRPLTAEGDLASQMVDGIDRFLLSETDGVVARRAENWKRAAKDPLAQRAALLRMIGGLDPRLARQEAEAIGTSQQVAHGEGYDVLRVRWAVLPGVFGEGLLLRPHLQVPHAYVIALPDADQTPQQIVGLVDGVAPESQFARRLAESGCWVVVPALVSRDDTVSVTDGGQATNQPHREFVYRPAFEMGRHIIGYEVQKVLALVDHFVGRQQRIGVMGYGEGGLLALYAGAADSRIHAVCVSGYFGPREGLWREPIYRNVFGLLNRFGDAELAALTRRLTVEASSAPGVDGPPPPREGRRGAAPGKISTAELAAVRNEFDRARRLVEEGAEPSDLKLVVSGDGAGSPGTDAALASFLLHLHTADGDTKLAPPDKAPALDVGLASPRSQQKRLVRELSDYTQSVFRESSYTRERFWSRADRKSQSVEKWKESTKWYRDYFENDVIGKFDRPLLDPNVRTRKVYDEPKFAGYEVMLDVFPDVFAYGILLVPKDIKEGERRPVVVCQHGLEGRPQDVADPKVDSPYYHRFACQLAEQGFVTYAPQNPYIFGDRFRTLQRKANPLGKTLFSIIVPQHRQTTDWLASLPFVDPSRIAFYGLSYGGKTAMRVPPLVDRYCMSICSADFNEWVWKNTSIRSPYSYVPNMEYEIFEWDLGNTFNYAEMAGLICPRPFMVERGHRDGVAPDEMVAYEFAKVKLLYTDLKIPDLARIEFFDGPHSIHGVGTFEFLRGQLNWPPAKQ
jgi:dienelactone hydrolase